jgi:hypothetical protein
MRSLPAPGLMFEPFNLPAANPKVRAATPRLPDGWANCRFPVVGEIQAPTPFAVSDGQLDQFVAVRAPKVQPLQIPSPALDNEETLSDVSFVWSVFNELYV